MLGNLIILIYFNKTFYNDYLNFVADEVAGKALTYNTRSLAVELKLEL